MLSSLYARVNGFNDMALRLFVACGQIADQTGHEEVAYEFFAQAFTVYEEAISDSRAQFQAVCVIAGALHQSRGFGKENYDTLITKCALHGSKLLKKPDQCRAVYLASHLFWATPVTALGEEDTKDVSLLARVGMIVYWWQQLYRDGKRVLECLQRALRVADACMDTAVSVELFVEILNRYVYYFEQENDAVSPLHPLRTVNHGINALQVTTKYLNGLIELIHSNLQSNETTAALDNPRKHFQRTLDYIAASNFEGVVTNPLAA
jgi:vacuolar protein sorting-associated protein 35